MSNIFFHGIWRMDWGFGNPNKTAAFIAILMIAVWTLAYIRKVGFWVALVAFSGLMIALVHTLSRGGMIALVISILPLLAWAPRPWRRPRLIGIIVVFWILVGAALVLKANERYSQGIVQEDRSISSRFEIWRSAPAMMVDSPSGWGLGHAADSYVQWYQPIEIGDRYKSLINSHLTWLVEFGWPLRLLYIFGWASVFFICWPSQKARWRAVAVAVWLCFFVAAFFSSVAEEPTMWVIPALFFIAAIVDRLVRKDFPSPVLWVIPGGATAAVVLAIWFLGQRSSALHASQNMVILGSKEPTTWIVYDPTTMGNLYGKSIRSEFGPNLPSIGILFASASFPKLSGKTLVLGSSVPEGTSIAIKKAVHECSRLILLSPRFFPQEIGIDSATGKKVRTYFGDFSQSPSVDDWRTLNPSGFEQLSGIGDFIPNWPPMIVNTSSEHGNHS